LLVKDVERMRDNLEIPALHRVRVLLEAGDQKLAINMECIACEELLEWSASKHWWICTCCGQETTEREAGDLFAACAEALQRVLGGVEDEDEDKSEGGDVGPGPDEDATATTMIDAGKGMAGRWAGRILSKLMGL
jgi:hypothetical protein